jgi:excisionase family DNA binding protein
VIEPLLTADQVAAILGTNRVNTVYELAAIGGLPSYRVKGIGRRFRQSEVEAWLEGQRAQGASPLRSAATAALPRAPNFFKRGGRGVGEGQGVHRTRQAITDSDWE